MHITPDNPHDKLFKWAFSRVENAIPEFRAVLPHALLQRIDLTTLRVESGEFVDAALRGSHSDLLYTVELSGKQAFIYLLFEHMSTSPSLAPIPLLRYVSRILDREAGRRKGPPMPAVIPIVIHHSETGWTAARCLEDVFDPELVRDPVLGAFVPRLTFVLDDISHLGDDALKARALGLTASLVLWALRDARAHHRLLGTFPHWLPTMRELLDAPNGREALDTILYYITAVAELTAEDLAGHVGQLNAPEIKEAIMTIAEQLQAKGRAEGEAKGRAEGARVVLLRLLTLKFGELPPDVSRRAADASEELLATWTERILSATSLDQVFEDVR